VVASFEASKGEPGTDKTGASSYQDVHCSLPTLYLDFPDEINAIYGTLLAEPRENSLDFLEFPL
jgi:hypothetical protein